MPRMKDSKVADLRAGWGTADITPRRTSELFGQYYRRVARSVRDPLGVTVLALEQRRDGSPVAQAIFVSCDQAMVGPDLIDAVRGRLRTAIPDFDASRLVVSATHTHCAPTSYDSLKWWRHDPALLQPEEYRDVLRDGIVSAASAAWSSRVPSAVGSALGHASVGHCRRPHYLDGSSEMYGATDRPDFINLEAGDDDTIGVTGTWDASGRLSGLVVNVACPSQVMEATYVVTADLFGEMRRRVGEALGRPLPVLCHVGAAGDQAPRDLTQPHRGGPTYWDEAGMVELGGRLARAVAEALPKAEAARSSDVVLRHEVLSLRLPLRMVNIAEYARAAAELAALAAREPADDTAPESAYARFVARTQEREKLPVPGPYDDKNDDFVLMRNLEAVVQKFRHQQQHEPVFPAEIHVLRIGDLALSTSPFELYLDYGLRIRARCPAALTLHVQLSCGEGGYLPTARAVSAGGYGALVANGTVGPEGGQLLVESILEALRRLFPA
jgi:hypothetical protein